MSNEFEGRTIQTVLGNDSGNQFVRRDIEGGIVDPHALGRPYFRRIAQFDRDQPAVPQRTVSNTD